MKKGGKLRKPLIIFCVTLTWLTIWLIVSLFAEKTGYGLLLPTPRAVLYALFDMLKEKDFYISVAKSLLRVLAGWISGVVAGTLLAMLTHISKAANYFFSPVLHVIKATPVASFIILALVLMNKNNVPAFTGFLMSLPIVWANVSEGLNAPDKKMLEMAKAFKMSRKNEIKYIRLPAFMPYFTAAATTSMGLTWKACVAAEVICTPQNSVGAGIYNTKVYLETPSLFAWTLTVIIFSVILEKLIKLILSKGEKKD